MELQGSLEVAVEHCQHRNLLEANGLRPADIVFDVYAIRIAGEDYRPGLFVLTERNSPTFALIQHVYVYEKRVFFILLPWRTTAFENRYCAYRVESITGCHPVV